MSFVRKYPYDAVWLSPTSLADFDKCPRYYFLRNVYKDSKTGRKIQIVSPSMSLGSAVHQTIESISLLPVQDRFTIPLQSTFEKIWEKYSGKIGGFQSSEQEQFYKVRGKKMIQTIEGNPGPLKNFANKIHSEVPNMWLSEQELLVLCGVIDWIEVLPDNSLHIIDFKTGKSEENSESLQLGIYILIAHHKLTRKVSKTSYWYLDRESLPKEKPLPQESEVQEVLIHKGKIIRDTRRVGEYLCPQKGCRYCIEYEAVLKGQLLNVGFDDKMKRDLYFPPIK